MSRLGRDLAKLVGSRELADALLATTTLRHLAAASFPELLAFMPAASAIRFRAALRVARDVAAPRRPRALNSAADAFALLSPLLVGRETERMVVVACDPRRRPIATEVVAEGSPSEVSVHLGSAFAVAVRHRASAIVLGHNHPSGDPAPSPHDELLTARFVQAGLILGITVLDHLVVGGTRYASLREFRPRIFVSPWTPEGQ